MGAVRGGLPSVNRPCDRFCGRDACAKLGCQNATPEYFEETRGNPLGSLYPMAIEKLKMQEQFAFDWNNQQRTRAPKQRQAKVEPPGICDVCVNATFPKRIIKRIPPDFRNASQHWANTTPISSPAPVDDSQPQEWTRADGRLAAMLVADALGDSAELHTKRGKRDWDVRFAGANIDVSFTHHARGHLLEWEDRKLRGDIAILVVAKGDDAVSIVGWIPVERFHQIAQPPHWVSKKPCIEVDQVSLNGMDAFCLSCQRINGWTA